MFNFISYTQYKKQKPINETYESYVELEELAENTIKNFKKFSLFKKLKKNKIYTLNSFIDKKFKTIDDFINNWKVGVVYANKDPNEFIGGKYIPKEQFSFISSNEEFVSFLNKKLDSIIIIFTLSSDTMLHELQHCYDDYRSKGKFTNTKTAFKYRTMKKPETKLPISTETSEEEFKKKRDTLINDITNYYSLYTKSPHEMSSFFVQTIKKMNFFIDKKKLYLKDLRTAWEDFKELYINYEYLNPNAKKSIVRKFSQFYHKIKER
jgi:hypothetical protein